MTTRTEPKFEDELAELEAVVMRIDSGELSLEDSISAFERGVGLVRSLNQQLDQVDRRVEVLSRGARGDLRSTPFQGEEVYVENTNGRPPDVVKGEPKDDDDIPF